MKKTYSTPLIEEVCVATESMIAASLEVGSTSVNTKTDGVQLGGSQRGEWGDLWK